MSHKCHARATARDCTQSARDCTRLHATAREVYTSARKVHADARNCTQLFTSARWCTQGHMKVFNRDLYISSPFLAMMIDWEINIGLGILRAPLRDCNFANTARSTYLP